MKIMNDNHVQPFYTTKEFPSIIKGIIADLRSIIDRLDSDFKSIKELILELARKLDEENVCERKKISALIKNILEDKTREGRITGRWIEECLPQEYKRKYSKSEVSSLSKADSENILVQQLEAGDIGSEENIEADVQDSVSSPRKSIQNSDEGNLVKYDPKQSVSDLLEFEFYLTFSEVNQYMTSIFPKVGEEGKVWFSGTINKNTGKVTYAQPDRRERLPIEYHR